MPENFLIKAQFSKSQEVREKSEHSGSKREQRKKRSNNSNGRAVDYHPADPGSNPRLDTLRIQKINATVQLLLQLIVTLAIGGYHCIS